MTTKTDNHAEEQAAAQYLSIVRMLAAVECDYDRLEELRDECEELLTLRQECANLRQAQAQQGASKSATEALVLFECESGDRLRELEDLLENELQELAELEDAAGECTDEDEARQVIQEDPLEVQVRSDWTNPGETLEAGEFMILLCTGGPAVRVVGELNRGEPCRAWLEYQDWGTPWTQWFGAESDTLCEYAANFFFGE